MNKGKKFEENWKKSVPDNIYYKRLNDNASIFTNSNAEYSVKNPFDCIMFNGKNLFCFELKSTKYNRMSFEDRPNMSKGVMIHYYQIEGLRNASMYDNIYAGFIFNFRNDDKNTEVTYYQSIEDFDNMTKNINKHSFNILDLLQYNPIKIDCEKKRVNYRYNVGKLLDTLGGK